MEPTLQEGHQTPGEGPKSGQDHFQNLREGEILFHAPRGDRHIIVI